MNRHARKVAFHAETQVWSRPKTVSVNNLLKGNSTVDFVGLRRKECTVIKFLNSASAGGFKAPS